jgi:hypothetical protein
MADIPKEKVPSAQLKARLDGWLDRKGLLGNPFEHWSAEDDLNLPEYFMDIGNFTEFLRLNMPCAVFARRGCGKTAQRQMVAMECRPLNGASLQLAVSYTFNGFEQVLESVNYQIDQVHPLHHVNALLTLCITALANEAKRSAEIQCALENVDVAPRFATFITHFTPNLAEPPIVAPMDRLKGLDSVSLLKEFSALIRDVGLESCIIMVDGIDEFINTASDPVDAVKFLAPLMGTLSIIECPGVIFKFFLPEEMEQFIRGQKWFRADRFHIVSIEWSKDDLWELIGQRLYCHSKRRPRYEDLAELCDDELGEVIKEQLTVVINGLPRNALIIADQLLRYHCQSPNPPEQIGLKTWNETRSWWLQTYDQEEKTHHEKPNGKPDEISFVAKIGHPLLRVEPEKGFIWVGEDEIRSQIKAKEYSLLLCLYRHSPEFCSKELIAEEAWPEAKSSKYVSDQAIAASAARLRKVLRKKAPDTDYIETAKGKLRKEGSYRLLPHGFDKEKYEE